MKNPEQVSGLEISSENPKEVVSHQDGKQLDTNAVPSRSISKLKLEMMDILASGKATLSGEIWEW